MLLPSPRFPCRWECRCVPQRCGRREECLGMSGLREKGLLRFYFRANRAELMNRHSGIQGCGWVCDLHNN